MSFIWIGKPKYHLCLFLAEHFSKNRHALLKTCQFLLLFVDIWSIFVNVRTYLLYGTVYCTVLRTYLPVRAVQIKRYYY